MTPPLTQPVTWEVKVVSLAMLATAAAMPFGRRDDWTGWTALLIMGAAAVAIWGLLIRGMAYRAGQWWRDRAEGEQEGAPKIGDC